MPPNLEETAKGVAIYDRQDRYICTVYEGKDKEPVPLWKISQNMQNAILAAEDHNFYTHAGLDGRAITRAIIHNFQAGKIVEGASTITQQLARNQYLDPNDRSFQRKIYEAYLALQIESRYSKKKILEQYLNEIYFGKGAYGIERAASHYFNKHAAQLTVCESAYLAGLVRSPTLLARPENHATAVERRNNVIDAMEQDGFISPAAAQTARNTTLAFKEGSHRLRYPHYISHVVTLLGKELGSDLWRRGYKAYTNLDPALQQLAQQSLNTGLKTAPKGINQGSLVTMKLDDGAVLAMVGGVGAYDSNQWNRALHPHTAGSSFKPFVYLSGILSGVLSQDSLIADTPLVIKTAFCKDYSPKNYDGGFNGWMTVRDALARSRNVCSVRVAMATGLDRVVDTARSAGIRTQLDMYPSLALGSCAVSPLNMTEAYGTIARAGVKLEPQFLRKIETRDGYIVKRFAPAPSRNFPEEETARLIDALKDVVDHGTGTRARLPGIPVAGKTGTADKGKDLWFIGFTPEYVTSVWGGSDHNQAVAGHNVTGGQVMAGLWKTYMSSLYRIHKPNTRLAFAQPQRPLLRSIPLFSDEALLSYSGVDSTGGLMRLNYNIKPIGQAWNINVDGEVSGDGIAGAIAVQKVGAEHRREVAELQKYEQYRTALEHGDAATALQPEIPPRLPTRLAPETLPQRLQPEPQAMSIPGVGGVRAGNGSRNTATSTALPSTLSATEAASPVSAAIAAASTATPATQKIAASPIRTASGEVAGSAPNPLIEYDAKNQIRNPSTDAKEKKKKKKKDDDDSKDDDSDDDKTDEFAVNLNQYRRHLTAPRLESPNVQEYSSRPNRDLFPSTE